MPSDREPGTPDDVAPPAQRRRFGLLCLSLRLAAAAAMIAGISQLALSTLRPAAPVAAAEPFVSSSVPEIPVPAAIGTARLALAEPGLDPVSVSPGRLDPATGLREDALTRGAFEALHRSDDRVLQRSDRRSRGSVGSIGDRCLRA